MPHSSPEGLQYERWVGVVPLFSSRLVAVRCFPSRGAIRRISSIRRIRTTLRLSGRPCGLPVRHLRQRGVRMNQDGADPADRRVLGSIPRPNEPVFRW